VEEIVESIGQKEYDALAFAGQSNACENEAGYVEFPFQVKPYD
jgi:hypothetical protein